jgi:D-alanyl-D-alanine carboxypeptidase (penicillin-binding protein 5/6)
VLNAPDMFNDCMKIMNYGFENYENKLIMKSGEYVGDVAVEEGMTDSFTLYTDKDIYFPLTDVEFEQLKKNVNIEKSVNAPIEKGQQVGTIDLWLGDNRLCSVALKAPHSIGENSYEFNLNKLLDFWMNTRLLDM